MLAVRTEFEAILVGVGFGEVFVCDFGGEWHDDGLLGAGCGEELEGGAGEALLCVR